ncbi:MAG: fumarylacetoacetate hydrolase family protein [Dehalococcoidia bacterium]|nr:fumarylacetoacetate hydrolase family protein [Dehalococcoidia bacterium]
MQAYYELHAGSGPRQVRARRVFGAVANMGTALSKDPVIFMKPPEAVITEGENIRVPPGETALFEGELVVAIGHDGRNISPQNAMRYVAGYGAGLDMTLERFRTNREEGVPWALAKGFDTSACVSNFIAAAEVPDYRKLTVELEHNGELKQQGSLADLITPIPELIAWISRFIALVPGDLIFVGTPPGAAPVEPEDRLTVRVPGVAEATFNVGW